MDSGDTHGAMARAAISGAPGWARDGAIALGGRGRLDMWRPPGARLRGSTTPRAMRAWSKSL